MCLRLSVLSEAFMKNAAWSLPELMYRKSWAFSTITLRFFLLGRGGGGVGGVYTIWGDINLPIYISAPFLLTLSPPQFCQEKIYKAECVLRNRDLCGQRMQTGRDAVPGGGLPHLAPVLQLIRDGAVAVLGHLRTRQLSGFRAGRHQGQLLCFFSLKNKF